jgi:hypothetical protein
MSMTILIVVKISDYEINITNNQVLIPAYVVSIGPGNYLLSSLFLYSLFLYSLFEIP